MMFLLAVTHVGADHAPRWYDTEVAGYVMDSSEKHRPLAVHDGKTGFFLVRDVECDGADITVLLTRDHSMMRQFGVSMPGAEPAELTLQEKRLPSLSTGKGIRIGDTEGRMREILGKPTKVEISGSRDQYEDCIYQWKCPRDRFGLERAIEERYTFKAGSLIEVEFSSDAGVD
jgi:hypothetical protein